MTTNGAEAAKVARELAPRIDNLAKSLRRHRAWNVVLGLALALGAIAFALGVVGVRNAAAKSTQGRDVLCRYVNRQAAAARQDREALIVFTTPRPPATMPPDRKAVADQYLAYGDLLYPPLDCADVRAGRNPPGLPPLPPSPLSATTTTTTAP